jgi:hypothetical protein
MSSCTVMRRIKVKAGLANPESGDINFTIGEWVTEPCGNPLFGTEEITSGKCRACASGWTHPLNQFATEESN